MAFNPIVDEEKCEGCEECVDVCPVNVVDEWSGNLGWRKAIYIPYPQSVPASYSIDDQSCLGLSPLTCGKCIEACDKKAIIYEDRDRDYTYKVGAVVVAVGFKPFDAGRIPEYGYNRFDNVLTTLEFERLINAATCLGMLDGVIEDAVGVEIHAVDLAGQAQAGEAQLHRLLQGLDDEGRTVQLFRTADSGPASRSPSRLHSSARTSSGTSATSVHPPRRVERGSADRR